MSQLRKIQRNLRRDTQNHSEAQDEGLEDLIPEHHLKLPVGKVISEPVRGDFLTIPLFGWVSLRLKTNTPLVMLTTLLIRSPEDPKPCGSLQIELPVFDDTELCTLGVLERYGWDGRVWPTDPGWPEEVSDEASVLRMLIESAGLKATLTFPPSGLGVATQTVTVGRARGPFLMPPLPTPENPPDEAKLEKLRWLCANPTMLLSSPLQ